MWAFGQDVGFLRSMWAFDVGFYGAEASIRSDLSERVRPRDLHMFPNSCLGIS
jgi:hypothetical protein